MDEDRVVAHVEAVVVDLIDIDRADAVDRSDERGLSVPREVAAVEEAEAAEVEPKGDAVCVVAWVLRLFAPEREPFSSHNALRPCVRPIPERGASVSP